MHLYDQYNLRTLCYAPTPGLAYLRVSARKATMVPSAADRHTITGGPAVQAMLSDGHTYERAAVQVRVLPPPPYHELRVCVCLTGERCVCACAGMAAGRAHGIPRDL